MRASAVRKLVVLTAIGLGTSLVINGIAGAASTTATVLSDQGNYTGTFKAGPVKYHYTVKSTKCSLYSDHDAGAIFPCKVSAVVVVPPPPGNPSGTSTLTSADGTTKCAFILTPFTATSYKAAGPCTETDKPDLPPPPPPPPVAYAATVTGVVTPNIAAGTVVATFTISELATKP